MPPAPWKRLHTALTRSMWGMWLVVLNINVSIGEYNSEGLLEVDLLPTFVGWWIIAIALGTIRDLSREVITLRRLAWGLVVINLLGVFKFTNTPPDSDYIRYELPYAPSETFEFFYGMRDMVGWVLGMLFFWKMLRLTQQIAERNGADELSQKASLGRIYFCGTQLLFVPIVWLCGIAAPPGATLLVVVVAFAFILVAATYVWFFLRRVSAWAEGNASAGATWFELWDGEEIEMAEHSQSGPWSFRISTLLLGSALLAAIVSHWTLARKMESMRKEVAHAQVESDTYRERLQEILVDDHARIYVRIVPTVDDFSWEWSVFIPQGKEIAWRVKLNDIDPDKIASSFDGQQILPGGRSVLKAQIDIESGTLTWTVVRPGGGYVVRSNEVKKYSHETSSTLLLDTDNWSVSDFGFSDRRHLFSFQYDLSAEEDLPADFHPCVLGGGNGSNTPLPGVQFWLDNTN